MVVGGAWAAPPPPPLPPPAAGRLDAEEEDAGGGGGSGPRAAAPAAAAVAAVPAEADPAAPADGAPPPPLVTCFTNFLRLGRYCGAVSRFSCVYPSSQSGGYDLFLDSSTSLRPHDTWITSSSVPCVCMWMHVGSMPDATVLGLLGLMCECDACDEARGIGGGEGGEREGVEERNVDKHVRARARGAEGEA